MSRGDEERALRRLNFSDLKFLQDFFRVLPGSPSLSEAARQLDISREENLHHRLKRILRNLDDHPPVNDGTKITREGQELEVVLHEIWRVAGPLISAKARGRMQARGPRRVVRLAMPEVMTNRSFTDLLRKIHKQPWAEGMELETRRLAPNRLNAAKERWSGRYDLVMTLSQAKKRRRGTPATPDAPGANLRRVLLVLNNDDIVEKSLAGSWPAASDLQGRQVYLPPERLWPGFPEHRLEQCDIHRVGSFAEAHSYALVGRKALAAAHPELLDEVEDELCDTIQLGPDAGSTRIELHQRPGMDDELINDVYQLIATHLKGLGREAERADKVNTNLSRYKWVAYTSDAPDETRAALVSSAAAAAWRWKYWSLTNFHVTALGHLKGGLRLFGTRKKSFHLTGRIMHDKAGGNHILWNSVDDETEPGDTQPKVEHNSVNLIFDDARLNEALPLIGLWSGRISDLQPWEPSCGAILIATGPLEPEELNTELRAFQKDRLHLWKIPSLLANPAP